MWKRLLRCVPPLSAEPGSRRRGSRLDALLGLAVGLSTAACVAAPATSPAVPVTTTPPWQMPSRDECATTYAETPVETGPIGESALVEASGVVASPSQSNVLWLHNDSGDRPRLYAVSPEGAALARLEVTGVEWSDAEDIAAAPCPDGRGPCLWVADIGNNRRNRIEVYLYAIPEPALDPQQAPQSLVIPLESVWRYPVRYPEAAFDAEAMVVTPDARTVVILEKIDGPAARVYSLTAPLSQESANVLELRGSLDSPGVEIEGGRMITAADLHPAGQRMLLRVYTGVYEVWLGEVGVLGLPSRSIQLVTLGPLSEPQGEAIAYDESGRGFFTLSEARDGQSPPPLHHFRCVD